MNQMWDGLSFMVDVETTSLKPSHEYNNVFEIALIPFVLRTKTMYAERRFVKTIKVHPASWEPGTREFWEKTPESKEYFERSQDNSMPLRDVCVLLRDYVERETKNFGGNFWCRHTHFDWPMIENMFRQTGFDGLTNTVKNPFSYKHVYDQPTFMAAIGPDIDPKLRPGAYAARHEAFDDALQQLQDMFYVMEQVENGSSTFAQVFNG